MSKSLKLYGGSALAIAVVLTGAVNFANRNIAPMPTDAATLTPLPAPIPEPEAPVQKTEVAAPAEAASDDQSELASTGETEDAEAATADAEAATAEGGLIASAHADEATAGTRFGLGRAALPEEISAWDVSISPDGSNLPDGSGSVEDGEMLFSENCAACHGEFAEGVGNWPKLAGGEGTLANRDPVKTVGSYWPYLSTVWDYVHRSMPFGNAQSLNSDEVYAITAYILYSNFIVEDDFVLSKENFLEVEMPNADGFIIDDRAEAEYTQWRTEPCMEACKDSVEITMRATVLDVTPDEEEADAGQSDAMAREAAPEAAPVEDTATAAAPEAGDTATAAAPEAEDTAPIETAAAALDPALVAEGEKVFRKCKACHQVGEGAKNRVGPHLNGILGRDVASVDGFNYSGAMSEMDGVWTSEILAAFLADPRNTVKGTKMAFAGLKQDEEIAAVAAYLASVPPNE